MKRLALVAGAGILLIGGIAVSVVLWATSGPVDSSSLAGAPAAGPEGSAPLRGPLPPLPPLAPGPSTLALRVPSSGSPAVSDGQRAWEQIRPLTKPIAPLVQALSAPVAPCFDEEVQARHGPRPHSSVSDAQRPGSGPSTLVLQLEAVPGGLRIVDAPVGVQGSASDGLVACAQQALRGRTVPLPHVTYAPGERMTMAYPLRSGPSSAPPAQAPAPGADTFRRQRGKAMPPQPAR